MSRIIVISLVVANLLLLAFQSSAPSVKPEARPAPAAVRDTTGVPTIHLFSEMMQDQGLMSGNRRCFTIGPFHSVADWDDVHARLQKVATRISERQTEALVEKGYWVYMPPYPSLLEANQALLSLQALGLKDVAIIYDGEWKNSISLGYFMRQENAQRRKKALEDRGFKPMMRIQRQSEPRFWLDYEQEPGSGLVELDMQNRPNDFMQRPVPCPEAEFLEADAAAAQDTGGNQAEAQTPGERDQETGIEPGAGQVAGDTAESVPVQNENETAVDGPKTAPETAIEPGEASARSDATTADEVQATLEDGTDEPPNAGDMRKAPGDDVETVSSELADKATDGGDKQEQADEMGGAATAEVQSPPKQAVGTGPVDMVATEPGPVATGAGEQDAVNPADGAPENKTADAAEAPAGGGNKDTATVPPADSGAQKAAEETEKDNGNGTVNGR